MNDLEKQSKEMTEATPEISANEEILKETVSSQNNDDSACEDACVIDSSPALDIAEEADRLMEAEKEGEEDKKEKEQESSEELPSEKESKEEKPETNYHSMNKEELIEALKGILNEGDLEKHKEVAVIKQCYYSLMNKEVAVEMEAYVEAGNDPSTFSATPDAGEQEMKELLAEFKEKRAQHLEEKEELRKKNLEDKKAIIEKLKEIAEDIDNINLQFPVFQQLQQEFKKIGEVPPGAENDIWKSYQTAIEQFYDRLKMNKELRDLDFKKNLELKNLLIEKARALVELADPVEAFKNLQSLHEQWREIGPVAREIREEIWGSFKEASTAVNKRHQEFFQNRKANEAVNEAAKTELCEKAESVDKESMNNFKDWDEATKLILGLQQEWKTLGFASKKMNNVLFARFRKACDDFFTAKAEFFKKTKEESKENLQKKEALCERAEALVEKYQEKGSLDKIQELQKEWRTIGVVRRRQGDEVWKRFCAAIDAFYDARKKQMSGRREEENENLEIKKSIISRLKEISEDAERKEVIGTIRELQDEWQKTGHVPFKQKDAINQEYKEELDRLYGAFDIKENRQRMKRYEGELKKMEGDEGKLNREREKLLRAIESRQAELKTIENNLGFFNVKSSAGNSMLKEFERKIQKIKEEISQIQEKIDLLDKKEKTEE